MRKEESLCLVRLSLDPCPPDGFAAAADDDGDDEEEEIESGRLELEPMFSFQ